jgi:23S rRNA G2069 N7-methylase RlmK/C1962 C5-methylase RlmI
METLLLSRIEAAVKLRKLLGLPSNDTNVFRLVNSEGDRQVHALAGCISTFCVC